jgi:hypothetical protein
MVYSLLVITARNWTTIESIQDLKIFFRRDSGFVQPSLSAERKDHAPAETGRWASKALNQYEQQSSENVIPSDTLALPSLPVFIRLTATCMGTNG